MMLGRIRATPEVNCDYLRTDEDKSFDKRISHKQQKQDGQ